MNQLEKLKKVDLSKIGNEKLRELVQKNIEQFNEDKATDKGWQNLENMLKMIEGKYPEAMPDYKPEHKEPEAPKKEKKKVLGKSLKKTIEEQDTDKPEPKYKVGDKVYTYWDESGISSSKTKDGEHAFKKEGKVEKTRWDKDRNVNYYTVTYKDGVFITEETDLILSIPAKEYVKGSNRHPERNKFHVKEGVKKQDVGHLHQLIKHDDDTYMLVRKKGEVVDFEIIRKGKQWKVQCKTGDKRSYNTLVGAVSAIAKTIYNSEVVPILKQKREEAEAAKERREKRADAGLPVIKTPREDIQDTADKIVSKVKAKVKDEKSVTKDILATANQTLKMFSKLNKELKEKTERQKVADMAYKIYKLYSK